MALAGFADEVVFRAQAPSQVIVGRPFQLTFTLNDHGRELRAPEFTDFDVLAGPYTSTSSSTSFVNGHRTSSFTQTYTYTLMAQKAGTFTIGPATIRVDGENVQSNGVRIQVLPEDEQPQQQQQEQDQQQQEQQEQQAQETEDRMDKETAEQILQALEQDEQDTQEKLQRQQGKKRRVEKEW